MEEKKSYHIRVSEDVHALLLQAAHRLRISPTKVATRLLEGVVRDQVEAEDLGLPKVVSEAELRQAVLDLRASSRFQEASLLLLHPEKKPQLKKLREAVYQKMAEASGGAVGGDA